jgi:hypothetical protein
MFDMIINTAVLIIERELLKLEPQMRQFVLSQLSYYTEKMIEAIKEKLESCSQGHISYECDHDDDDLQ